MISRRFRDLRESQRKTQREISDGGGFPRSQLQILEAGGNVTLATLEKAISQLDGMRLEIIPAGLDVEEIRRATADLREIASQLLAVSDRVLQALGGAPPPPAASASASAGSATASTPATSTAVSAAAERPLPGGGGATRHEAGVDPALLDRLEKELEEAKRKRKKEGEH